MNPNGEPGVDIKCVLSEDWRKVTSGQSLVQKIQGEMTFTDTVTLSDSQIKSVVAAGRSALYAMGWNTLGKAAQDIADEFKAVTDIPDPEDVVDNEQTLVIPDFIDATITSTTTINGKDEPSVDIKNTHELVSVYIPVPDDLMQLLTDFGLTTDYIRVYRHHEPESGAPEIEELTRITEGNNTREGFYTITLTDQGNTRNYVVIRADKFSVYGFGVMLNAAPVAPVGPDSGSGSGGVTRYPVNVRDDITNGDVSVSHQQAAAGTQVTITVTPDDGYRLNGLTVTDQNGNRIEVTANADGTYTFTMPAGGVEVDANFAVTIADPEDTGVADWLNTEDHIAYMVGHNTGNFGPNGPVTRAQVAMMFYRLLKDQNVPVTASFSDVPADAWYAEAVNTLASLGIVEGVGGGKYQPNRAITRAEFCAIAARFTSAAQEGVQQFTDVPESHWAHDYIATANAYGWVTGVGNNRFAPSDDISRAQAAVIVNRMTGRLADQAAIDAGAGRRFPDVFKTHWAWYDIVEATTTHDYEKSGGTETWKN